VVLFDEDTPLRLIQLLRPDVLVKGADYAPDAIVGAKEVEGWGGRVVRVPLVKDKSTTKLLERLRG
jgi:bifunctional ADP-heptose synthase (sugar kinase/adenylyltransferase)